MPLRDDLLNPISGDNPSGKSLRYERVYDQIKEARTEDDESIPSGDWQRQAKRADFPLVIKLAGEALATKSKDLQLLAWLTEAHIKREGIALLEPCLQLFLKMQQEFWDTLYPEIEDGDVGMRTVPIEWTANRAAGLLREAPLTSSKLNFYEYKESRSIGYEADAASNEAKAAVRELAIKDGKATAEDFDKALASTPKTFYVGLEGALDSSLESLQTLQEFCEEKYGDDGPSFSKLRSAIEEVKQVVTALLNEKRKAEPDDAAQAEEAIEEPVVQQETDAAAAAHPQPKQGKSLSAEPVDWDDALARVNACALYLRTQNSGSPIPYLLQTAVRWGELREQGSSPSYDFLVSPSTEVRQALKRLSAESNWEELLTAALAAAGAPCGRAWLDVQRYIWKASYNGGYSAIAATVVASLQSLLKDIPELRHWTLDDDTPTANPETQQWLDEVVVPKPAEIVLSAPVLESETQLPAVAVASAFSMDIQTPEEQREAHVPDAYELAEQFMRQGQVESAIQLLMRDAAQQPSGRARFQRRMQVAQLCMAAGYGDVAHPVLEQLAQEIEQRKLEEWEAGEILAQPLALLLKCLEKTSNGTADRAAIFTKLCNIDPTAAINLSR